MTLIQLFNLPNLNILYTNIVNFNRENNYKIKYYYMIIFIYIKLTTKFFNSK